MSKRRNKNVGKELGQALSALAQLGDRVETLGSLAEDVNEEFEALKTQLEEFLSTKDLEEYVEAQSSTSTDFDDDVPF